MIAAIVAAIAAAIGGGSAYVGSCNECNCKAVHAQVDDDGKEFISVVAGSGEEKKLYLDK
jgi:hypothetical protein